MASERSRAVGMSWAACSGRTGHRTDRHPPHSGDAISREGLRHRSDDAIPQLTQDFGNRVVGVFGRIAGLSRMGRFS